jgi:hypothetical protein
LRERARADGCQWAQADSARQEACGGPLGRVRLRAPGGLSWCARPGGLLGHQHSYLGLPPRGPRTMAAATSLRLVLVLVTPDPHTLKVEDAQR